MRTMALSSSDTSRAILRLAHEALTRCTDERNGLREEDAHRVPQGDRLLEPPRRRADPVEVVGRRETRLGLEGRGQVGGGRFRGLDPLRRLGLAELAQPLPELGEIAAAGRLFGYLAEGGELRGFADRR